MTKQTVEPEVLNQISHGYIQTNAISDVDPGITHLGQLSLLGSEIDSTIYAYNQICANFYMTNYFRSNYGENPSINVPTGEYLHTNQLAVYSELWKLNFKLQDSFRAFYQHLDDSISVRVYNNEPIMINTPSRSGYVVIHPSVQPNLVTGTDEYGAYYEANLGGLEDPNAIIAGQYVQTRRLMGRRGGAPRIYL